MTAKIAMRCVTFSVYGIVWWVVGFGLKKPSVAGQVGMRKANQSHPTLTIYRLLFLLLADSLD